MGAPVKRAVPLAVPPCLLTPLGGIFFNALPGTITLALTDLTGNTDFVCAHCAVNDVTHPPSTPVVVNCAAKQMSFTVVAGHKYRVQLAFVQLPTPGSSAQLREKPCGQLLDLITSGNQIQTWSVQA